MAYLKVNLLDAATATGPTAAVDVPGATTFTIHATVTGAPTSAFVSLEGTIDGTNWFLLLGVNAAGPGSNGSVNGRPVMAMRVNLATLSGGSSPTVSASVIAV